MSPQLWVETFHQLVAMMSPILFGRIHVLAIGRHTLSRQDFATMGVALAAVRSGSESREHRQLGRCVQFVETS